MERKPTGIEPIEALKTLHVTRLFHRAVSIAAAKSGLSIRAWLEVTLMPRLNESGAFDDAKRSIEPGGEHD